MLEKLKKHDIIATFLALKGNPKWSIATEPLWFVPYALFSPFASLYMYQLGLNSEQIGLIISLGFALQVFFALVGGVITDKLGRRLTTLIFDTISWTIPCLLWAFADNFWWFLLAAAINASYQITNTSWHCLFIEDCPAVHLTNACTMIQLAGSLAVFVSPIAIYYVGLYSVVEVVSVVYFISAISMTLKFVLLYVFGGETEVGKQRMAETKGVSIWQLFRGYGAVCGKILRSSNMRFVLIFIALLNIILIATNNFFSLYITLHLDISDEIVAVFPMLRTFVMLVFVAMLQNAMNHLKMKNSLLIGFVLYLASHLCLLLAPAQNLWLVAVYTILEAAAYATVFPRKDALMSFYVDAQDRSRIYAIFNAGMIGLSSPFGYIVGKLFRINHSYPFVFNIGMFALCVLLIMNVKAVADYDVEVAKAMG